MKINWYPSSYQRKKITNCTEEKNVYLIITLSAFSLYLSALCFPLTIPRCFSHTFTRIAWPNLQAYRSLQKFSSFLLQCNINFHYPSFPSIFTLFSQFTLFSISSPAPYPPPAFRRIIAFPLLRAPGHTPHSRHFMHLAMPGPLLSAHKGSES